MFPLLCLAVLCLKIKYTFDVRIWTLWSYLNCKFYIVDNYMYVNITSFFSRFDFLSSFFLSSFFLSSLAFLISFNFFSGFASSFLALA